PPVPTLLSMLSLPDALPIFGTAAGQRSKYVLAPWLQTHPASSRRRNVAHRPSWSARRREERGAFGPQRASSRTGQFALEEFAADELTVNCSRSTGLGAGTARCGRAPWPVRKRPNENRPVSRIGRGFA